MNTDKTDTNFLYKDLCHQILGAMFATRNSYGAHQKESLYQKGFSEELQDRHLEFSTEVPIEIVSPKSGKPMGKYRLDFLIDKKVIVETKALAYIPKKIEDQLYNYLRSTPYQVGYLINFASTNLYYKRIILTNNRKPFLKLSVP